MNWAHGLVAFGLSKFGPKRITSNSLSLIGLCTSFSSQLKLVQADSEG